MMTLTEFLAARLDEDDARAAFDSIHFHQGRIEPDRRTRDWATRVRAEVVAKRQIIEAHLDGSAWCDHCHGGEHMGNPEACPTMQLLASVYADSSDYRTEWRP